MLFPLPLGPMIDEDLAEVDAEVDPVQDEVVAEALADALELDHRRAVSAGSAAASVAPSLTTEKSNGSGSVTSSGLTRARARRTLPESVVEREEACNMKVHSCISLRLAAVL